MRVRVSKLHESEQMYNKCIYNNNDKAVPVIIKVRVLPGHVSAHLLHILSTFFNTRVSLQVYYYIIIILISKTF